MALQFNPFTGTFDVTTKGDTGAVAAAGDGTAAAPGIAFASEAGLGIYRPGAGQLALATNGTGRLFVDANGNVGINTSPSSLGSSVTTLEIKGSTTTRSGGLRVSSSDSSVKGAFYIYDGAGVLGTESATPLGFYTGNTERMRLDSSGRLGLGSSTPNSILETKGTNAGGEFEGLRLTNNSTNNNTSSSIIFNLSTASQNSAKIAAIRTNSPGSSDTELAFSQFRNGVLTERLRIDSQGRVGVGSTTPQSPLDVTSVGNVGPTANDGIRVYSANRAQYTNVGYFGVNTTSASFTFNVQDTERARIDNSGRLLVGTSSARTAWNNSTIGSNLLQIERGVDGGDASISICANSGTSSTADTAAILYLGKTRGTAPGSTNAVASGDCLGRVSFQGSDGTEQVEAAKIEAFVDTTSGANDMPGRLVFSTNGGAPNTSPTERMRISSTGLVTIAGDTVKVATAKTPASATAAGTAGEICWDANYIYVCTATNTWKRTAIATW